MDTEPYNETVRQLFAHPLHAGDLQAGYAPVYSADVSASDAGCRVILAAELDGDVLVALRYRVFGCPHLIAAAEAACSKFEGGPIEALREFSLPDLLSRLAVPVEKTGRILLLEDAIGALHGKMTQC